MCEKIIPRLKIIKWNPSREVTENGQVHTIIKYRERKKEKEHRNQHFWYTRAGQS